MIDESFADRKLVASLLAGDENAFETFVDEYYPRVRRFAISRLPGDLEMVDDVVQSTFEKVIRNLGKYRGEAALFTWMCSFCRYEIAGRLRKRGRSAEVPLIEERPDVRAVLESLAHDERDPAADFESAEMARLVRVVLDHLPLHYSQSLELKYMENLSTREIGSRMNLSSKAAESLLTRARGAFRDGFRAVAGRSV